MSEPKFLSDPDLQESRLMHFLFALCRRLKINSGWLGRFARKAEGGAMRSKTLRRILWHQFGVQAEAWSYGGLHEPGKAVAGVVIGRYANVAREVSHGHNHPSYRLAMSPVFYDPQWRFTDRWTIELAGLEIGADAWIGSQVVIVETCRRIGIGAIVGAGSVVTRDVPDFAIVVGAPARVVRYRFPEEVQKRILDSRWWLHTPVELARFRDAFQEPAVQDIVTHALARMRQELPSCPAPDCSCALR